MNKAQIIQAIVEQLEAQLSTLVASARAAQQAATHEDSKPENEYDTRGLEASYLAGAQAARAEEIRAQLSAFRLATPRAFKAKEPIDILALVELEDDDGKRGTYFLAEGRGMTVTVGGKAVQVVTPSSPLGRELLSKTVGDSVDIEVRGETRGYTVLSVK